MSSAGSRPPVRRTAARSPSPSAAHTHTAPASGPIADSPDTSPPPPRLARSAPSSDTEYETGPRLEATRICEAEAMWRTLAARGNAQTYAGRGAHGSGHSGARGAAPRTGARVHDLPGQNT
ncbi:hypothetical protein GCM10018793_55530 [Streptomyces sulfonofaciens]|uniref:Uncharacterized protein n=1 Tax=Streptomyces sulfonofaciens TaxID=68272 RepID=A0A919GKV4_9ACTN|nr:hypothetical protein GCM10018793_55530 [Streptomyces sulfonofaciens]